MSEPCRPQLLAIDPPGCGCTDCLTGESVPLDRATDDQVRAMIAGDLTDRTGGHWTVIHTVEFSYAGVHRRSWHQPEAVPADG